MASKSAVAGDSRIPSWLQSPLTIILAAALIRGVLLLTFEGTIQDGVTRVGATANWLFHGSGIFGRTSWPEGNYLLPAAALLIWNEPYWSVRILYALLGVTNVWLIYLLGRALYGRAAGAIAAWIVACMPFHAQQSVEVATSEVPYLSCIILSLLAIVRYVKNPSPSLAIYGGLSLTLATTFRFDGVVWGIPLGASIAVAAARHRLPPWRVARDLTLFGVCGIAFPAALFARWMQLYTDPFYMISRGKLMTEEFFVQGEHARWPRWLYQSYTLGFWPASTFVVLTPLVAALGWTGLACAIRERRLAALPVVLGIVVVCIWLGYAAFRHDILVQWRYALVVVAPLSVFCLPGAEALTRLWPVFTGRRIAAATLITAAASAAAVIVLAFVDAGTLSRQIGTLSPIRPGQFASRDLLTWIRLNVGSSDPVLFTPHAVEQPYLAMHIAELGRAGSVIAQSYFVPPSGDLVYSHAALTDQLMTNISRACYVVTSTSTRELGLRDGLYRELIDPVRVKDDVYVWHGISLRLLSRFGSNLVWGVMHPGSQPLSTPEATCPE
jgi:4-amino-4-deoxy-L-arabinose transferase-like glycosyltransferase